VKRIRQRIVSYSAQTTDKVVLDGLAKARFKTNLGPYGAGLVHLLFARGGGYYVDTGTSKHVINDDIKLESGSTIECF